MDPGSPESEAHFRWWLRARDAYFAEQLGVALACTERYRERETAQRVRIHLHSRILTDLHRFDDAWPLIEQMMRWKRKPDTAYAIAQFFDARNDIENAERWYLHQRAFEPGSTAGAILLGAFYAGRGKLSEAEATHRHATTLAGDPDEAFLNLGIVLRAQGRFEEALEAVQRAVALDPTSTTSASVLADLEQAIALSREPPDADDAWSRAVNGWGGRGRIGEALVAIKHYRQCNPRSELALIVHAEILTDLRRFDEAWALLQQVQETRSWREWSVFDAVTRHLRLCGDLATAEAWHLRRRRDEPASLHGLIGLGAVYTEQGRLADAEATYREATTLDGDRDEAFFHLGLALRSQGRFGEAVAAITRVREHPRAAGVLADVTQAAALVTAASPD